MANAIEIKLVGIQNIDEASQLISRVPVAAQRAVNRTGNFARAESSRRVREQVQFAARYLSGADGKIQLIPATQQSLQAKLTVRSRPTSLARFASGTKKNVRVTVAPGSTRSLPGAFLLGVGSNTLLAVRGVNRPRTAFKPRRLGKSLWVLYGPSLAQVLVAKNERKGVWPSMEAQLGAMLETEFLRQMKLSV